MTDGEEVIDTALRIADEASQSLVESTGLKDSPGVYVLDDDALQDDAVAERRRQIEVEGWTPEHDDHHSNGEMSLAAGLYAISAGFATKYLNGETKTCPVPDGWPWAEAWWKPVNARRDLVKSVALGLAEIERLDRAERIADADGNYGETR